MGTRIDSVATAHGRGGIFSRGALRLSDSAARACLDRGAHDAGDIDLLVNAGLYKDGNMAEPALASIIQEDIHANPGHPARLGRHGTFSFDVLNGGCGVLSALQLVDGFVGPGTARLGLIVAADANPTPRLTHFFPFPSVGGAVLVEHTDGDEGFERFDVRCFPEDAALFEARLEWDPIEELSHLEIHERPSFAGRCLAHATDAARDLLAGAGLRATDVDVLVASQYPRRFADLLARALEVPADRVPIVGAQLLGAHTAGPLAALESAFQSGTFARAKNVLFVAAGAGITIATALYRRHRP